MERKIRELEATINALESGSISLTPSAAVSTIDSWQAHLQGSNQPELQQIASDLGELKRRLTSGTLDDRVIGQILTRIGTQTSNAATNADANTQPKLQQLAQLLSRAGGVLS